MATSHKKILNYTEDEMKQALQAVKSGMPISTAAKMYRVPRTTLLYKHTGKYPLQRRMGPCTVLTENEESLLVKWIFHLSDAGFPVTKSQLCDSVQMLLKDLKRPNPFKENRPGRHWYESFLRRHSKVAERISQNLCGSRAAISEENLRGWFDEIINYLKKNTTDYSGIVNDPRRIFNMDETAFFLSPKGEKVLVKKGQKVVYNFVNNDEKECLTVLLGGNAIGMQTPPMVVFSYERIPQAIVNGMPAGWGIGKTENGWMTSESFFEYIANIFYPWVVKNNIPFPIILYVDGHTSHLTMALSDFCTKHQIILIALYPNATHICQPMDVSIFRPLKSGWRKGVQKWKIYNNGRKIKRENFGPILKSVIDGTLTNDMFINGFRTCGLYPLDPNAINYKKLLQKSPGDHVIKNNDTITGTVTEESTISDISNLPIRLIEDYIGKEKVALFRNCDGDEWNGDMKDTSLFKFWKEISSNHQNLRLSSEESKGEIIETLESEMLSKLLDNSDGQLLYELDNISFILNGSNDTIVQDLKQVIPDQLEVPLSTDDISNKTEDYLNPNNNYNETDKTETKSEYNIRYEDNEFNGHAGKAEGNLCTEENENTIVTKMKTNVLCNENNDLRKIEDNVTDEPKNDDAKKVIIHQNIVIKKSVEHQHETTENVITPRQCVGEVTHKTPLKTQSVEDLTSKTSVPSSSHIPLDVPSPFKRVLFWPDSSNTKTKKRRKEKIPSVATSDLWKNYYLKKENDKQRKEKEKEERKLKREEKKKQLKKVASKKAKSKVAEDDLTTEDDNSGNLSETEEERPHEVDKNDIHENTYVIVVYENKFYPGIVQELKQDEALVNVMTKTKYGNWKWPKPEDKIWYTMDEIVEIIEAPIASNNRGIFKVKEMNKY